MSNDSLVAQIEEGEDAPQEQSTSQIEMTKKLSGFEVQLITEEEKVEIQKNISKLDAKLAKADREYGQVRRELNAERAKLDVEESLMEVNYPFECYPDEGAYAIFCAVKNIFGDVDLKAEKTASGKKSPELKNIKLPNGDYLKVPWGNIQLPVFSEGSYIEIDYDPDDAVLRMHGEVARKNIPAMDQVAKETQRLLNEESIYKGQAVRINFDHIENGGSPEEPEFMDLSNISEDTIILSDSAKSDLVPVYVRIEDTKTCLKNKLDLKYGALMEGPYGTGKTLIAFLTAKKAVDNGWTFMYLKDCNQTEYALRLAERFSNRQDNKGVVLFTEDIDQAVRGDRDKAMQGILNTLDGGDTKGIPVISIFTTNHIELIEPTILRGKRIGSVISLGGLDEKTSKQFLKAVAVNSEGEPLISESEIAKCYSSLVGVVPAFVAEIIDRAKSYMVAGGRTTLSGKDIVSAADSYKHQQSLSKLKKKDNENEIIGKLVKNMAHRLVDGRLLSVDNPEIREDLSEEGE